MITIDNPTETIVEREVEIPVIVENPTIVVETEIEREKTVLLQNTITHHVYHPVYWFLLVAHLSSLGMIIYLTINLW